MARIVHDVSCCYVHSLLMNVVNGWYCCSVLPFVVSCSVLLLLVVH